MWQASRYAHTTEKIVVLMFRTVSMRGRFQGKVIFMGQHISRLVSATTQSTLARCRGRNIFMAQQIALLLTTKTILAEIAVRI